MPTETPRCALCGKTDPSELVPIVAGGPQLTRWITDKLGHPVDRDDRLCRICMNRERITQSVTRLEKERGELTEIESQIAAHAASHLAIARNTQLAFEQAKSLGQRVSDRVAAIGGSWAFVIGFFLVLAGWIAINLIESTHAFDPYPFILLNLVLSTLAAVQAPIIMMSQNRVAARDRAEADEDFRTNLKAELEVASLHEKLDHLLHAQWDQLVEMQQVQLDLLQQLIEATKAKEAKSDASPR